MNLLKKLWLSCLLIFSIIAINYTAQARGGKTKYLSCTNTSYGTQLGGVYLEYNPTTTRTGNADTYAMYTSEDCVYAGAGRTNSSAIVGGEIARAAANAVVGAITNRINTSMAMAANPDTSSHMTYSANHGGVGMAANHIVGGMSAWINFSSTDFENDQVFSQFSRDSNQYEASASSFSVGVDKALGNLLVGLSVNSFSSDVDTKANSGRIETEGETYGLYLGLHTGPMTISAGGGFGEYEISTRRQDMGNAALDIKGSNINADVQYMFINVSGTFSRGKLSFTPRLGYRNFEIDVPAFTDIVPDVTAGTDLGAAIDATNADEAIAAKTYSSNMSEAGISIALGAGRLTPFIDLAYVNEDTTKAAYSSELKDDGFADIAGTSPDGFVTYGGGFILNLSSKVNGHLSYMQTGTRDDFSETVVSGNLRLKF